MSKIDKLDHFMLALLNEVRAYDALDYDMTLDYIDKRDHYIKMLGISYSDFADLSVSIRSILDL